MNVWLCPIRPKNWRITKKIKIFGVPKQVYKKFSQLKQGDLLVFHVFKPIDGIVAVAKVVSEVFEDHTNIWGVDRYPFRVRIELVSDLIRDEKNPVHLSFLFEPINDDKNLRIEPYLKSVLIARISAAQYEKLKTLFQKSKVSGK